MHGPMSTSGKWSRQKKNRESKVRAYPEQDPAAGAERGLHVEALIVAWKEGEKTENAFEICEHHIAPH